MYAQSLVFSHELRPHAIDDAPLEPGDVHLEIGLTEGCSNAAIIVIVPDATSLGYDESAYYVHLAIAGDLLFLTLSTSANAKLSQISIFSNNHMLGATQEYPL